MIINLDSGSFLKQPTSLAMHKNQEILDACPASLHTDYTVVSAAGIQPAPIPHTPAHLPSQISIC